MTEAGVLWEVREGFQCLHRARMIYDKSSPVWTHVPTDTECRTIWLAVISQAQNDACMGGYNGETTIDHLTAQERPYAKAWLEGVKFRDLPELHEMVSVSGKRIRNRLRSYKGVDFRSMCDMADLNPEKIKELTRAREAQITGENHG